MTTKPHAKNQLIWTKNGREMAVRSFLSPFGVILTPKSLPDQLWGLIARLAGLGWGDDIHRWNRMLGGYKNMQKKHGSAPNPGPLEPNNIKKSSFWGHFLRFFGHFSGVFGLIGLIF